MSDQRTAPVEFTARYATSVPDMTSAWAFVMAYVDQVGPDPSVTILPRWIVSADTDETPREFDVVVSGMVEVGALEGGATR